MLAITIASILMLAAMRRYNEYRLEREVTVLQQNEHIVMQAMNEYFFNYCNGQVVYPFGLSPTMDDLKGKELSVIDYSALRDAWGTGNINTDFVVSINKAAGLPTTLMLTINFSKITNVNLLEWYKEHLNASYIDRVNKTLIWSKVPRYTVPGMESNLWVLNAKVNQFTRSQNNKSNAGCFSS